MSRRTRRAVLVSVVAVSLKKKGGAFVAAEATKSNTFCGTSCHEMEPYYRTWQASAHAEVDCVGCHIPPGLVSYAKTKLFGLRELWVHLTGQVEQPIAVTRHIPDEVCAGCHPDDEMRRGVSLAEWTADFTHTGHAEVPACIRCHARTVHEDVPGVPAEPPRTMEACFGCHDGASLPEDCAYCHPSSPHPDRGACEECHGLESWSSDFRHPDRLTGRHEEVLCERCHAQATASEIGPARACIDCHEAPHPLRFGRLSLRRCADCHVITHWRPNTFDHPRTDCASCHGNEHGRASLSRCEECHSQTTWADARHPTSDCLVCHENRHGGASFSQCQQCHSTTTWADARHPTSDCLACHENRHGGASFSQCQQCHSTTTWAGARHPNSDCTACHSPGRLHAGLGSTCQSCHVSGAYWVPSTFRHQQVGEHIPSGEHRLTCTACHRTTYASATCTPCHGPGGPGDD